ncbi:MAG: ribbon-helix-helix protein, CopG family [Thermoflexaceae bacterium]|nr:ribbon-helix-helix protein, CopG family [Thermoflexaceae bacterium]
MALVRVQVLLEEADVAALEREARRLRLSRCEVMRRSLRAFAGPCEEDPFPAMVGAMDGETATDLARRHDTCIYGGEMRP